MTERVLWGGRYALFGEIAAGGMATVYLAARLDKSPAIPPVVALKKLSEQLAKQPEFVAMFLDEAHLAARIRHPNVVTTYEFLRTSEGLGIVMDLVVGESFVSLLRGDTVDVTPPPLLVTTAILVGALDGLHAAHEVTDDTGRPLGLIHRDMSPHNILVGADGVARVIDFGIAKAAGRLQTTDVGIIKGKFAYMSPEQVHGDELDRVTDIYSAGIVLWEALVGRQLFRASTNQELLTKRSAGIASIPPPRRLNPDVPPGLERIVLRALENEPKKRYPTAREMAEDIRAEVGVAEPRAVAAWVREQVGPKLDLLDARRREILSSVAPTLSEAAAPPPAPRRASFGEELVLSDGPNDGPPATLDLEGPLPRPLEVRSRTSQAPPSRTSRPPHVSVPPVRVRPRVREPRSRGGTLTLVATLVLVAVLAGGYLRAPAMIKARAIEAAADRGLVLTVDHAEPTRTGGILHGVTVSFAGSSSITLKADEVDLDHISDLRRATIPGYELAVHGSIADVASQLAVWRKAPHEPLVLDATRGHVVWTNALAPAVTFEALAVSLGILADGALTIDTAGLLVTLPRGHAGPWHAHVDTSLAETRVRLGFDASNPEAPPSATFIERALDGATWSLDVPRASTFKIGMPNELFGVTGSFGVEAVLRAHVGPKGTPLVADGHLGLYDLQTGAPGRPTDLVVSGNVSGDPTSPLPLLGGKLAIGKTISAVSGALTLAPDGLRVEIEHPGAGKPASPTQNPALVMDTRAWTTPEENRRPNP